jgi:hypothetical protein
MFTNLDIIRITKLFLIGNKYRKVHAFICLFTERDAIQHLTSLWQENRLLLLSVLRGLVHTKKILSVKPLYLLHTTTDSLIVDDGDEVLNMRVLKYLHVVGTS